MEDESFIEIKHDNSVEEYLLERIAFLENQSELLCSKLYNHSKANLRDSNKSDEEILSEFNNILDSLYECLERLFRKISQMNCRINNENDEQ